MSVQFLAQWNGFEQYQIVHTLSGAEETRLIGLQICRAWTAALDDRSPVAVSFDPDTSEQRAGQYPVSGAGKGAHASILKLFPGSTGYTVQVVTAGTPKTQMLHYSAPGAGNPLVAGGYFNGVKLVFENYDTAATMALPRVKVGSPANGLATLDTAIPNWTDVTFGGSLAGVVPIATVGPGGQIIPGILYSDLIFLLSAVRTDGGTRGEIRVAVLQAAGLTTTVRAYPSATAPGFNADAINPGYQVGGLVLGADYVTGAPNSGTSVVADGGGSGVPCVGALFYTSASGASGAAFGDSIFHGNTNATPSYFLGWVAQITLGDKGISWANYAAASQKTVDTRETLRRYLASSPKPDYVAFKTWSPNDGTTQANFDQAWLTALDMIQMCRDATVPFVVLTNTPVNSMSGAENTRRVAQNAKTRALMAGGTLVADVGLAVADPADPSKWVAAYVSADGTHPSKAGHGVMGGVVSARIGF